MKKAVVFTSIFIILLISASFKGFSQFYTWMPQQALTDSAADNTNPSLIHFMDYNSWNDHIILFWERSESSSETAIWYRHLDNHSLSEPELLIAAPGIHFTHPIILLHSSAPATDTAFSVIFGSDEAGDVNLYFMNYSVDGTFSAPRPLSLLPGDDVQASVCHGWIDYLVWINNGKILTTEYDWQNNMFFAPMVLQNSSAENPAGDEKSLGYLTHEGDSSRVMYFNVSYQGGYSFEGPVQLYCGGENTHLEVCKSFDWAASYAMGYTWQNRMDGGLWGIMNGSDSYFSNYLWGIHSTQFNYHSPDLFDFPVIIKFPTFLTFVTDSLGNDEVMTCRPGPEEILNQSNFEGPDRNPHFFSSVEYSVYQVQLLWESFRNGHWTIFRSHYDMMFSNPEQQQSENGLASPNPFHNKVTISMTGERGEQGKVLNLLNLPVKSVLPVTERSGSNNTYVWDGCDDSGCPVPAGTYLFIVSGNQGRQVVRLLKQ